MVRLPTPETSAWIALKRHYPCFDEEIIRTHFQAQERARSSCERTCRSSSRAEAAMGQAGRGSTSKVPMAPNIHCKVRSELEGQRGKVIGHAC